jgi:radical SAM/Cys-rich protein
LLLKTLRESVTPPPPSKSFSATLSDHGLALLRGVPEVLQINTGKLCNLTCSHCHVNAGPQRREIITRETLDRIIDWLHSTEIPTVDLTGGAPEMVPDFRYTIERLRALPFPRRIIDRCNLTILLEPGYEGLAEFLAAHRVEIIASMPCYSPANVNAQRGEGVFDASIRALQILNQLGYGISSELPLDLVYNPLGATLPPPQAELEADYKNALHEHFGIRFRHLYTITNMPIARFAASLRHQGRYSDYLALLREHFNPAAVAGLMCRHTLNIGWRGEVYDCDFNQMLHLGWGQGAPRYLWDLKIEDLAQQEILTGEHCFGCTAGSGSSCAGTLVS